MELLILGIVAASSGYLYYQHINSLPYKREKLKRLKKENELLKKKKLRLELKAQKELADVIKKEGIRSCPKHKSVKMEKRKVEGVWIDKCGKCKGVFLDGNELAKLRRLAAEDGYSSGYSSGNSSGHSSGLATGLVLGMVID